MPNPIYTTTNNYDPAMNLGFKVPLQDLDTTGATNGDVVTYSSITGLAEWANPTGGSSILTDGHIFVGDVGNLAQDVAASGDVTLINTGAFTVTKINGASLGTTTATPGNILVADAGNLWQSVTVTKDATVDNAGLLTVVGIQGFTVIAGPYSNGDSLFFDGTFWHPRTTESYNLIDRIYTTTGGAATENISAGLFGTVLATDRVYVQLSNDGTNNVSVVSAVCNNGSVDVTFSGDPSNDAVINILVTRNSS